MTRIESTRAGIRVDLPVQVVGNPDGEDANIMLASPVPEATIERATVRLTNRARMTIHAKPQDRTLDIHLQVVVPAIIREPGANPWTPREDLVRTSRLVVTPAAPLSLHVVPGLLFLHPSRSTYEAVLQTNSREPLLVLQPEAPSWISVEGNSAGDLWVSQERPLALTLRINGSPEDAEVRFPTEAGASAKLVLKNRHAVGSGIASRYVIGIDFGTDGTSLVVRERNGLKRDFILKPRFPTAVFIPWNKEEPAVPAQEWHWLYGERALATSAGGQLIRELKKEIIDGWGEVPGMPGVAYQDVLRWYFATLLEEHIKPYMESRLGRRLSSHDASFVFSIPVLDQERRAAYAARLITAAEQAGYGQIGPIRTELEPVCALQALVELSNIDEHVRLRPGDRVAVVDSGGGTTDVCVSTLDHDGISLTLKDDATCVSVTFPEAHEAGDIVSPDFGGSDVTRMLGVICLLRKYDAFMQLGLPSREDLTLLQNCYYLPDRQKHWYNHPSAKDLLNRFEEAKKFFSNAEDDRDGDSRQSIVIKGTIQADKEEYGDVVEYFRRKLQSVLRSMFEAEKSINAVVWVGGNSLIKEFRELGTGLPRSEAANVSDSLRRMAVPLGTTWLPNPQKLPLAYDVRVRIATQFATSSPEVVTFHKGQTPPCPAYETSYVLEAGETLSVVVFAELEGNSFLQHSATYRPPVSESGILRVQLDSRLEVTVVPAGGSVQCIVQYQP